MHTYLQCHQVVHIKDAQLFIRQSYLNMGAFKMQNAPSFSQNNMPQMKILLDGMNSILDITGDRIANLRM